MFLIVDHKATLEVIIWKTKYSCSKGITLFKKIFFQIKQGTYESSIPGDNLDIEQFFSEASDDIKTDVIYLLFDKVSSSSKQVRKYGAYIYTILHWLSILN